MPPRVRRTYTKKGSVKEHSENENKHSPVREKNIKVTDELGDFDKLLLVSTNEKINFKPLSFWSKKLQDLESQKGVSKKKKCGLYDFSGTDDSQSSLYKKKKKPKRKPGAQKPDFVKYSKAIKRANKVPNNKKRKPTLIHFKDNILLDQEREKLAEKGKNFTFSTGVPSLGVTSTPAMNKDNLVSASSFLFISPIKKEDIDNLSYTNVRCTPLRSIVIETENLNSACQISNAEMRLKGISCRRVLRNGKVINM